MKKLLALSLVVVFALSGAVFAQTVGHGVTVAVPQRPVQTLPVNVEQAFAEDGVIARFLITTTGQAYMGILTQENTVAITNPTNMSDTVLSDIAKAIEAQNQNKGDINITFTPLPVLPLTLDAVNRNFVIVLRGVTPETVKEMATSSRANQLRYLVNPVGNMPYDRFVLIPAGENDSILALLNVSSRDVYHATNNPNGFVNASSVNAFIEAPAVERLTPTRDSSGCNAGLPLIAGILALSAFVFSRRK